MLPAICLPGPPGCWTRPGASTNGCSRTGCALTAPPTPASSPSAPMPRTWAAPRCGRGAAGLHARPPCRAVQGADHLCLPALPPPRRRACMRGCWRRAMRWMLSCTCTWCRRWGRVSHGRGRAGCSGHGGRHRARRLCAAEPCTLCLTGCRRCRRRGGPRALAYGAARAARATHADAQLQRHTRAGGRAVLCDPCRHTASARVARNGSSARGQRMFCQPIAARVPAPVPLHRRWRRRWRPSRASWARSWGYTG